MPEEFSRTTARKTVQLPSGETIDVPCITKISFIDPFKQYQEYQYQIDNTDQVERAVHVDILNPVPVNEDGVPTDEAPAADDSQELFTERIDTWKVVDPFDRYQESAMTLDNATGSDLLPPNFSTHIRTHIYRYHQDPQNPDDDGVWVDSELIDEFSVIDPFEQYQERRFTLSNPTNAEFRDGDLSGQASEDDPDLTIGGGDGEGTIENPVRLDPFQNIVNYNSGVGIFIIFESRFIGTGLQNGGAIIHTSKDGVIWSEFNTGNYSFAFGGYGNGEWLITNEVMYDFEFGSLYELILASANGLNWTEVWSDTEANKFVFAINYQNTTNDFQISVSQPNPPELIPCVVPKDKIKMPNGEINMPTGEPIYTNFPNGITNVKLEFDGVLGFYISKDHGATWTRTLAMTNNTQATLSYQVPGIKF